MAVIFDPPTRAQRRRSRPAAGTAPRRQPPAEQVAPPGSARNEAPKAAAASGKPPAGTVAAPERPRDRPAAAPARTGRARPRRLAQAPVRTPVRAPVRPLARATKTAVRARAEGKVQPQRREPQRRTMRPRQLAVVLAVAALGALLLNAASMERDAQTSAFGLRRTAALAVLQPLAAFSHALGLDRPRAALAGLAGQDDSGSLGGGSHDSADGSPQTGGTLLPVATVADTAPARRSPSADRVIATRVPTRADPLRVWVGGDSVAGFFGFGLDDLAAATGTVAAHSHYQISTGLSRPDYYDWPAHLEADMRAYNPEVVILLVGANDDQPLAVGNQVDDFGSGAWKAEYARRVGAAMDQILAEHRMVVWVGQPVMRAADFDAHMQLENAIYRSEAARRPGVVFFDSRPVLSDGSGGYRPYLPDGSGGVSLMRAGDGIHLTPAGGRRLARAVLDAVLTELASRGETFTVSGVR